MLYDGSEALSAVISRLGIPTNRPVLIVAGAAAGDMDADLIDSLRMLMARVIAPVCRAFDVVVISGGTNVGVMALLGRAIGEFAPEAVLIGVAPHSKIRGCGADPRDEDTADPEPHHRLITTAGDGWGTEGPVLVDLAERVAGRRPILMVAVGGGEGTRREIALAARRRWPILLLTGCEGESDDTAAALGVVPPLGATPMQEEASATPEPLKPEVVEAAADGYVEALHHRDRDLIERSLQWRLGDDAVLREAWTRFAATDGLASRLKTPTTCLAGSVVGLATATVVGGLIYAAARQRLDQVPGADWLDGLKLVVTACPLAAAAILRMVDRRARSGAWVEMRAAAETLIREIYRARARAGAYGSGRDWRAVLSDRLRDIDVRLDGRSSVLTEETPRVRLWPPPALAARIPLVDSLVGQMTCAVYDEARVCDQLSFMTLATRSTERQATRLAVVIFVLAGMGALLLAVSWRAEDAVWWAAVVGSFLAALLSWREYAQYDVRSNAFRATAVAVRDARTRWLALPEKERECPEQLARYVEDVETALAAEGSDWERSLNQAHHGFADRYRGG